MLKSHRYNQDKPISNESRYLLLAQTECCKYLVHTLVLEHNDHKLSIEKTDRKIMYFLCVFFMSLSWQIDHVHVD
jgi:hypothetical protein